MLQCGEPCNPATDVPLVPLRGGRVSGKRLSSGKVLTSLEVFMNA